MRFNSFSLGIAAMTAAFIGSTAMATNYTWNAGANGNWNNSGNWTPSGVPDDENDTATIGTYTVTFDMSSATRIGQVTLSSNATLNVEDASNSRELILDTAGSLSGKLIVQPGSTLNIGDHGIVALEDTGVSHEIGGTINLTSFTSVPPQLRVGASSSDSVVLAPYSSTFGSVVGADENALIQIANGATLTYQIRLIGEMEVAPITGTATLIAQRVSTDSNSAVMLANAGGVFFLHPNLVLDDTAFMGSYRPKFEANGSGSMLEFGREFGQSSPLEGDFVANNAVLAFDAAGRTNGSLSRVSGGSIQLPCEDYCFEYAPVDNVYSFECGEGACE